MTSANNSIPALLPRGKGHQFLLYGDSCSGVPGALHEKTFASVNAVVQRLRPQPEFVLFPGDEIIGLTPDPDALRAVALLAGYGNGMARPCGHSDVAHNRQSHDL
ncbi:hypothetical protein ABIF78_011018 [Bradyrhizobium japonicum]